MLADIVDLVIGCDPDRDRVTIAVVDSRSLRVIDSASFATTAGGYEAAIEWADEHGSAEVRAWAIEGANSYGSGLCQVLTGRDELVVEFDHPLGPAAPDGAKSDHLDAVRAAREALGRERQSQPRARGEREAIRALLTTRETAVKDRTRAINNLKALLISAPVSLRDDMSGLGMVKLIKTCAGLRPHNTVCVETAATKTALRASARRIQSLETEIAELTQALAQLVTGLAPQLLDEIGVGVITAAQIIVSWSHPGRCRNEAAFCRLSGTAPIEAASGQNQTRHRLNRGGDRRLNSAIHQIVITRTTCDTRTQAYIDKKLSEGKTRRDARRCLKRYVARHLYRLLENPPQNTT